MVERSGVLLITLINEKTRENDKNKNKYNIKNIIIYIFMFIKAYDLTCIINATSKNIFLTKCNKSIS